jgi:hypothetical protein
MQSLNLFAIEARRYTSWAECREGDDPITPRNALLRITALYSAALQLPSPWSDELDSSESDEEYSLEPFNRIMANAQNFPFRGYAEVFNPFAEPVEEPVLADIAADLAEIYEDIRRGLLHFDSGQFAEAQYQWGWAFQHHWGEHATGAIRAIHSYLSQNDCEDLTKKA